LIFIKLYIKKIFLIITSFSFSSAFNERALDHFCPSQLANFFYLSSNWLLASKRLSACAIPKIICLHILKKISMQYFCAFIQLLAATQNKGVLFISRHYSICEWLFTGQSDLNFLGVKSGCDELLATVQRRVRPKFHVFGHTHEGSLTSFPLW